MLLERLFKPCCLTGCSWQTALLLNPAHSSLNPLSPNSNQHQFSPNNIHRLSSATPMRINQMITKGKSLTFYQFLPTNSVRKCIEISLENFFVDIGAYRVKWISSDWLSRRSHGFNPGQINSLDSQRGQLTLSDASNSFPSYWCLRCKRRNCILMLVMSHYPDLGTYRASDWLKIFQTSRKIISSPVFQAALYV